MSDSSATPQRTLSLWAYLAHPRSLFLIVQLLFMCFIYIAPRFTCSRLFLDLRGGGGAVWEKDRGRQAFQSCVVWIIRMRWTVSLFCTLLCLFLLCFAVVCSSTGKHSKCRYDKRTEIHQETRSTKKFCDPAFNRQAASIITKVRQLGFLLHVTVLSIYFAPFVWRWGHMLWC